MSLKPDRTRVTAQRDIVGSPRKGLGSDKQCSAKLSDSDSKSDFDSPQRASPVGLRGGRNCKHSIAAKLAARIIKQPSGCWEVQGYPLHSGHIQISVGSPWNPPYVRVRAHVFAWEQANGRTVPKGLVVMHSCDNPRCANPDHLSIGTQRDNILDSIRKGRYNCFGRQKLNAEQVRKIRALSADGVLQKDIAARFGIRRNTVSGIVNRKSWDHLDPPFVAPADDRITNVERVPCVQLPVCGEVA